MQQAMVHRIRAASLSKYAEVARRAGLDPQRMLSEFGLPPRCLEEPELRVPLDALRQLLEASAARSGVEGFGLLMAEARLLSDLGPLGLLVREQPTLRLALDACVRYGRRLNEGLFLTVEESGDVVVLREELIVGQPGSVRQTTELAIGVAFRVLRTFLGAQWRPRRVCFAHNAPADRSVHERVFGRKVEFDHDSTASSAREATSRFPTRTPIPGSRGSRGRCWNRTPRRLHPKWRHRSAKWW